MENVSIAFGQRAQKLPSVCNLTKTESAVRLLSFRGLKVLSKQRHDFAFDVIFKQTTLTLNKTMSM